MAELPEIYMISQQISNELSGKTFIDVDIKQDKCLNMSKESFSDKLCDKRVVKAYNKGKWIFIELTDESYLLLNVGMGGDIIYYKPRSIWNNNYQGRFHFDDCSGFTCRFWWFGHMELLTARELLNHKPTKDIAFSPFDKEFTFDYMKSLLAGKRSRIKNLLLDQSKVAGIGNAYIHDILFLSRLHPNQPANVLTHNEIQKLYTNLKNYLKTAYDKKGCSYEKDFYGANGNFNSWDYIVGYHEGLACPICKTKISKIKTGTTSSYVCSTCQMIHG